MHDQLDPGHRLRHGLGLGGVDVVGVDAGHLSAELGQVIDYGGPDPTTGAGDQHRLIMEVSVHAAI